MFDGIVRGEKKKIMEFILGGVCTKTTKFFQKRVEFMHGVARGVHTRKKRGVYTPSIIQKRYSKKKKKRNERR